MKRIAVFASGSGTNFQAIVDSVVKGRIKSAKVCLLICDNPQAFCLKRAKKAGIKAIVVERKNFSNKKQFEKEILKHLKKEKIDLVCLAGFMRVLSPFFIKKYKNRILNIHPALLPSFKGAHGVRDALDYGVKVTGVTVHFVTEELDAGPIIIQEPVEISEDDTQESLLSKIHTKEHKIYPKAIDLFCRNKLKVMGRKVKFISLVFVSLVLLGRPAFGSENETKNQYLITQCFFPRFFLQWETSGAVESETLVSNESFYEPRDEISGWKPLKKEEYAKRKRELIYNSANLVAEFFDSIYLPYVSKGISRILELTSHFEQEAEQKKRATDQNYVFDLWRRYKIDVDPKNKEALLLYKKKY
jgi:phosphoribosylglycinamide formyltransferase-1